MALREETAVQHLQRALLVNQAEGSHIIQVGVTASDPVKAAHITNAVVKQYLDDQIAAKYRTTDRAYQWATEQVTTERQLLIAAENAAVEYMVAHGLTASNGLRQPNEAPPGRTTFGGLAGQQLFSLQDELAAARSQLAAKQARAAELADMQARNVGFGSLPEVTASPVIAELVKADTALRTQEARMASTYGAESEVLRLIRTTRASITQHMAAEIAGIAQNIRDEAETGRNRVAELEAMLKRGQQEYTDSERASVELRELTRDATAKRALYDKLLVQVNEISQQLALIEPDAVVISAAVPPTTRSFPNALVFGGIGVLGSLLLSGVLAALVEHNDKSLRTGPQVEQTLGLINLDVFNDRVDVQENALIALERGIPYHPPAKPAPGVTTRAQADHRAFEPPTATRAMPLPLTERARQYHRRFIVGDVLAELLRKRPDLLREVLREPLSDSPFFDQKMPALMKDASGGPLHLTRRQYHILLCWAAGLAGAKGDAR